MSMTISSERIHLEVCLTKLETARFDSLAISCLVDRLRANLNGMDPRTKKAAFKTIDDQKAYLKNLDGIIEILEYNIRATPLGRELLEQMNERTI